MSKSSFVGVGRVVGMLPPVSTETLEVDAILDYGAFEARLFLIEYTPETADRLRQPSEHFRPDSNEESEQPYWLVYRSHWGVKQ